MQARTRAAVMGRRSGLDRRAQSSPDRQAGARQSSCTAGAIRARRHRWLVDRDNSVVVPCQWLRTTRVSSPVGHSPSSGRGQRGQDVNGKDGGTHTTPPE